MELYEFCAKIAGYLGCLTAGALVSWYLTKEHYDKIVKKEVESIREIQKKKMENDNKEMSTNYHDYENIAVEESYIRKEDIPKDDVFSDPYLIPMETFDDADPAFDKISLEYYTEDCMLIENDEPIDPDSTVGLDLLTRFGKRMDLIIMYVRNERLGVDYEVTKIIGKWVE